MQSISSVILPVAPPVLPRGSAPDAPASGPADRVTLSAGADGGRQRAVAVADAAASALPGPLAAGFRLIMSGPPGAGKSTHGERLAQQFHVPHISMGDLLRDEVRRGTDIGRQIEPILKSGDLVPAPIVAQVLSSRLELPDAQAGFILDGFPRRMDDALMLQDWSRRHGVASVPMLELDVPSEEVLRRVESRRICDSGHTVDIAAHPPRVPDRCDEDGTVLKRRPDDDPSVVRHRFEVYHKETEPVLNYYRSHGLLHVVSGVGPIDAVAARVLREAVTAQRGPQRAG